MRPLLALRFAGEPSSPRGPSTSSWCQRLYSAEVFRRYWENFRRRNRRGAGLCKGSRERWWGFSLSGGVCAGGERIVQPVTSIDQPEQQSIWQRRGRLELGRNSRFISVPSGRRERRKSDALMIGKAIAFPTRNLVNHWGNERRHSLRSRIASGLPG